MAKKDRMIQTEPGSMEALSLPSALVPLVTDWFSRAGRPLPWRDSPTPYHVWLSEIMLQQTRIEAVIPYYFRFLEAFPDIPALAEADEGRLLKLWEGLGYYSRARNLKKAAGLVAEKYGGALPADHTALRALPGVGDYTAGAIASIAFGLPEPAVDGNVLRLLARVSAWGEDVADPRTRKTAADALRAVYPSGPDAGLLTEGLMELGEVVCLPSGAPKCGLCPLAAFCEARKRGEAHRLPVRSPKKERRIEELTVVLVRCGDRVLVRRRPDGGLLGGMWEFPNFTGKLSAPDAAGELTALLGGAEVRSTQELGGAKHLFTHVEWRMTGAEITLSDVPRLPEGWAAATAEEMRGQYAVPTAFRKWQQIFERTGGR